MKLHLFGIATAAMIGCASLAHAGDPLIELPAGDKIVGSVTFATQYYARGLRQTDEGTPAVQAGLEYNHSSGIYIGAWGSNVSEEVIGSGAGIEIDFSAGFRGSVFDPKFTYDIGLVYYYYPGYEGALEADWIDGKLALGYDFGFAQTMFTVLATPEYQYESGTALYFGGDVTIPVGKLFSIFLHAGHQWIDNEARFGYKDYFDYSVGVGTNIVGLDLKLAYIGTSLDEDEVPANGGAEREAIVFTVSKSF
jgi:uncharacterized protein (TIGR02001 family)